MCSSAALSRTCWRLRCGSSRLSSTHLQNPASRTPFSKDVSSTLDSGFSLDRRRLLVLATTLPFFFFRTAVFFTKDTSKVGIVFLSQPVAHLTSGAQSPTIAQIGDKANFYNEAAITLSNQYLIQLPPVISKITRAELPKGFGTSIRRECFTG
jgi:hypothetical protein